MIVVIAGVSGTGKSTVGQKLADKLNIPFFDADDFHPLSNVNKMKDGVPLTDADRGPWLEVLSALLSDQEKKSGAVLACSALKETYRKQLSSKCIQPLQWLILTGSYELLKERLEGRSDHFLDSRLLNSQLSTLELPSYGLTINVQEGINEIVENAVCFLTRSNIN